MTTEDGWEITEVIVCGCGPTGAMLSGYLGKLSVKNVVLEQAHDITTDPRGIALDEEGIRNVQGLGLYKYIYKEIGTCMLQFQFIGGTKQDLHGTPFMLMDYSTTEGGTGHVGFICHKQPTLEKHLRQAMAATTHADLRLGATVIGVTEDENWVYAYYTDPSGTHRKIKAKFFVGADGKTGFTRKHYLEPRGVSMETAHNSKYEETWVALNWRISLPTRDSHPDFPLWKLGYTPEDVYDAFFPPNFRFLCNPDRPAVCGRFGLMSDRLWRFEFVVKQGENGMEMSSEKMIRKVVYPYLRHEGSRHGLPYDVEFPKDCIEVLRCRPFAFSARSCNRWAQGRVILCGDAAHVFPPFGGQGISSGFRDAVSLAWRLSVACSFHPNDYPRIEPLLIAWYKERKQQLERSLYSTVENGELVTERSPLKILWRDWYLWFLQLFPPVRHQLRLGNRRDGLIRYEHEPNMPFIPHMGGGKLFPQVYCVALSSASADVSFTDDVIWGSKKRGLFRLLILLKSLEELRTETEVLRQGLAQADSHLRLEDVTVIIEDPSIRLANEASGSFPCKNIYRIATADEFEASGLCIGRPTPKGYDPYRLGKEMAHCRLIILRPDKFVFAACTDVASCTFALREMARFLAGSPG